MKKGIITFVLVFFLASVSAQSSVQKANRRTAERCLKLAENCLVAGDWDNAIKQAVLGLSYDDSVSDLYYVKAASESNIGKKKAEVLNTINLAFENNNWVGHSKSGARILLADLLCDTGHYEKSLEILDDDPFIYSADAEYIRIKNYYRIGSEKTLEMARQKINTTRRIYPSDVRFPDIFFLFEASKVNILQETENKREIPEIVKAIADSYVLHLPEYSTDNSERELMASFIMDDDVSRRLVGSVMAREKYSTPLMAIAGKRTGILSDIDSVNMFFESSGESVSFELLKMMITQITDNDVKAVIAQKLSEYDGFLLVDDNMDFQNEMSIKYECGRPLYFSYDNNNDGIEDIYAVCDLGSPLSAYYGPEKIEVFYEYYPYVVKVNYLKDNFSYDFTKGDFMFSPFDIVPDSVCARIGADFYIPYVNNNITVPGSYEIVTKASSIAIKTEERNNSKVVYYSHDGNLSYADFYDGEKKYASCNFEEGFPFIRYVNYNDDDIFETIETYDLVPVSTIENENAGQFPEDKDYIRSLFGNVFDRQAVYLKKVQIDRNGNTNPEFSEEYLEGNGKIDLWDYDDNGVWDNQYIRYPLSENNDVLEENIFFDDMGRNSVSLITINKIPAKIKVDEEEISVFPGELENFFWVGEQEQDVMDSSIESLILEKLHGGMEQGAVDVVQVNELRFTVIKVGANYYCRQVVENEVE